MILDLTKDDLTRLVWGSTPHKDVEKLPIVAGARFLYTKTDKPFYCWSPRKMSYYSERELYQLYCICRGSWKSAAGEVKAHSVLVGSKDEI